MTFTVTYRDKDGALREECVEAANRAECVVACKERGIVPTGIREGRPSVRPRSGGGVSRSAQLFGKGKLIAVVVTVAAACGVGIAWWLWPRAEPQQEVHRPPKKVVTPPPVKRQPKVAEHPSRPAETNVAPTPEPVKIDPNARPEKVGETVNGYIKLPSGRLHKVRGVVTNDVAQATRGKYAIFPHHCENEIACYLSLKPGDAIFGTMKYNGRFKKEFLKSLETPIVIEPDDSEEVKELKRNVRDAKIQLKIAMDNGEDIEKIMADTRQELQDLARYKMDLTRHLHDMRHEGKLTTVEDLQDAVDAANKMLEARGIAPMKFGPLVRQKMLMELEKEQKK